MVNNIIKHWNKLWSDSLAGKDVPFSIDKVSKIYIGITFRGLAY